MALAARPGGGQLLIARRAAGVKLEHAVWARACYRLRARGIENRRQAWHRVAGFASQAPEGMILCRRPKASHQPAAPVPAAHHCCPRIDCLASRNRERNIGAIIA